MPVAFGGNNQSGPIEVATARNACASASASGRMDFESETFLVQPTHTLRGEGFDASADGTGRGTPLVPVGVTIHGTDPTVQKVASYDDLAQCLRARTPGNIDNSSTTVVQQPVAGVAMEDPVPPLMARSSRGGAQTLSPGHQTDGHMVAVPVAFPANLSGTQCASTENLAPSMGAKNPTAVAHSVRLANTSSNGWGVQEKVTHTLDCTAGPAVQHAMMVRRLTPEEAEALQGFTRGYTAIPWRKKPASECPDGPRYKALGNSWAVPNVRWIGMRIQLALERA